MTSADSESTSSLQGRLRRSRRWNIVLAVATAFLALVVFAQLLPQQSITASQPSAPPSASPSASPTPDQPSPADAPPYVRRDANDPMAIGDVDAPVVLTEWTDLRCPFCAVFSRDTLPVLIEQYVDTGLVRIEFTDVSFFGEQSENAAIAAAAAGSQGKYLEYVTAVFAVAPEGTHPDLPREKLVEFAIEVGVPDIAQFTADLDDAKIRAEVQTNHQFSQQLGVNSVPFFAANGVALAGAQPLENFQEYLDAAVAAAQ